MNISSTVIALNYQRNFEVITNANNYLIFIVDEPTNFSEITEINKFLQDKKLGEILLIYQQENSSAFSIIFDDIENIDRLLKILKRMLWETGVLLSTKIVLMSPEIKVLKQYGEHE